MTRAAAPRALLVLAAVAIGFAAADTYVVVLALPDMMLAGGLAIADLQQAAPIVSGFLLGYVAVLPVIGRISDLRGRVPVLLGSLVVFALGSLLTAAAYDLETIVLGRLVQGVGGGGLIPPTLALVADAWPPERRGLPLGVVGAVQELGSVLGPLYGAVVLAVGDWRAIFWLNAAVGLVLGAAVLQTGRRLRPAGVAVVRLRDPVGIVLVLAALAVLLVVMVEPDDLAAGVTSGLVFVPVAGSSRWLSPLALTGLGLVALFALWQAVAPRPLLDWRGWAGLGRQIDVLGAALLTSALGAVIVSFASAEPETGGLSAAAAWLLPVAAVATAGFVWRQRTAARPLVPPGAVASRPAVGALIVSFFVGAALIAALVDIPFYARLTVHPDSQLDAALVLVRFLVALPVGALLGGWLLRRWQPATVTAVGTGLSGLAFWHMSTWDATSLEHPVESLGLVVAGLGFGLAIAPVNAVLLEHTADAVHGLASALLVVARMIGMLIGISALTALGLQAFSRATERIPPVADVCDGSVSLCQDYRDAVRDAGLTQLHAVFEGAAVCCLLAAVLALALLRADRRTPG